MFPDAPAVGKIGAIMGHLNRNLFGVLAFIYPFALIVPAYIVYKGEESTMTKEEIANAIFSGTLLLISILMLQSQIAPYPLDGMIGTSAVAGLSHYIGSWGIWLFIVFMISISTVLLLDGSFENVPKRMDKLKKIKDIKPNVKKFLSKVTKEEDNSFIDAQASSFDKNNLPKDIPIDDKDIVVKTPVEPKKEVKEEVKEAPKSKVLDKKIEVKKEVVKPKIVAEDIELEKKTKEKIELIKKESEHILKGLVKKIKKDVSETKQVSEKTLTKPPEKKVEIQKKPIQNIEKKEVKPIIKRDEPKPIVKTIVKEEPKIVVKPIPKKEEPKPKVVDSTKNITYSGVIVKELEENKALLDQIDKGKDNKPKDFKLPETKYLEDPPAKKHHVDEGEIDQKIKDLLNKLKQFKIEGDVVRTYSGPVVTTFEFRPAAHIKVSKVLTLQDDLAMALKAKTIRLQAPIPGKDVIGIEIPNSKIQMIYLKEIIESEIFQKSSSELTIAIGKDVVGNPFVTDLKKLPHLLIAGTTGSGKSVGVNSMLVSLLYRNSPEQLKLLMIDPKMLEFSIYNDIPHLLTPVITQPKQAILALSNMVVEMERRYKLMSQTKTKNIENYNEKSKKEGGEIFPYIVIIIDELADLMMTSGKDVELYIARLAQMARAAGIHLIVATQRPSVDVVTGLIKANLPSRISFKVGQRIDSKIILDAQGAESLLGRGDMLFTPPGSSGLIRLHAPFVSEFEIEKIVDYLKAQQEVVYDESFLFDKDAIASSSTNRSSTSHDDLDELYEEAKKIVLSEKKTSISYIQRRLQIGYNRSARIIEQLEMAGVLSAPNVKGQREIIQM